MKLPRLDRPETYVGLYVFDFGEHAGVGFTAQEVAELLESERYRDGKVYKIHRAYADGRLELKGVRADIFQLGEGMFFYSQDIETARRDYKELVGLAVATAPPCRAKVHLAELREDKFVVSLIYPAEYNDEISRWLLDGDYKTTGAAEGGVGAVQRYYDANCDILERHQLFGSSCHDSRTGQELMAAVGQAVQR